MSLFDRATTTAMRDRTKSRNYSPERDEFRRDHERRRYWGLKRRHAEKLRQLHGDPAPPITPPANDDQQRPAPPAVPAEAAVPTPPPVSPDPAAGTPQPAHASTPGPAAAPTAPRSAAKSRIQPPRNNRRHSTPPVPARTTIQRRNHSGHETCVDVLNHTQFTHPQKARAPPTSAFFPTRGGLEPTPPSWASPGEQRNLRAPGRPVRSSPHGASESERVTALIKIG